MKKVTTALVALGATTLLMAGVNEAACKGCHGQSWEKAALGKSKVVAEMSHADIATALKGYKNGTYGGAMKGLMAGQVAKYSEADLDALAATIGK